MKPIIKKAIENGFKISDERYSGPTDYDSICIWYENYQDQNLVLDPKFWQALFKGDNWRCEDCLEPKSKDSFYCANCECNRTYKETWYLYCSTFHDINLSRGFKVAVDWLKNQI